MWYLGRYELYFRLYDAIFIKLKDCDGEQVHILRPRMRTHPASGWFELEQELIADSCRFWDAIEFNQL